MGTINGRATSMDQLICLILMFRVLLITALSRRILFISSEITDSESVLRMRVVIRNAGISLLIGNEQLGFAVGLLRIKFER